jgi:hypothetical protein
MPIIGTTYPNKRRYFGLLYQVFEGILQAPNPSAYINAIEQMVDGQTADEQLAFFHIEPLDVAAMALGVKPSVPQIDSYLRAVRSYNWEP